MKNIPTKQQNTHGNAPAITPAKGTDMNWIQTDAFVMLVDNNRFAYGNTPSSSTSSISADHSSRNPKELTVDTTRVELIEIFI